MISYLSGITWFLSVCCLSFCLSVCLFCLSVCLSCIPPLLNLYKVETISLYYLGCENLVSLVRLSVRNNLLAHVNELNCLVNLVHLAVLEIEGKLHHVHVQQEMCVLMTVKCGACMVLCKGNPLSRERSYRTSVFARLHHTARQVRNGLFTR